MVTKNFEANNSIVERLLESENRLKHSLDSRLQYLKSNIPTEEHSLEQTRDRKYRP